MLEAYLTQANAILSFICQIFSMLVILVGVLKALILYVRDLFTSRASHQTIQQMRLEIGYTFSLALAFLIGTSILKTGFAPTWNDIGQLAAIIAIRTILNYFLLQSINSNQMDRISA
jgi:uncharacterized membrane protein